MKGNDSVATWFSKSFPAQELPKDVRLKQMQLDTTFL